VKQDNNKLFLYSLPFIVSSGFATTLKEAVRATLMSNPQTSAIYQNIESFKYYIDEHQGDLKPKVNLEVAAEIQKEELKNDKIDRVTNKQGSTTTLTFEQKLYDGGGTNARIGKAKYDYEANKYKNLASIDDLVLESIKSYLDALRNEELLILAYNNINIHIEYLKKAQVDEEENGDDINRIQVESKLYIAYSKLYQQKVERMKAISQFKNLTTLDIKGYLCRPQMDESLIGADLQKAIDQVVRTNYSVLEQIERIKSQRETINQEKSKFLPQVNFIVQGVLDENLATTDSTTNTYSAKIKLNYNLYNGGKDTVTKQREKVFLNESQHKLDYITNRVVNNLKQSYYNYNIAKEKIEALKIVVYKDKLLLKRYKDQFESGTRTFMDILNIEADLFAQKGALIEEEFTLLSSYFEILAATSSLKDDILKQSDSVCEVPKVIILISPIEFFIKNFKIISSRGMDKLCFF
jgi:adhesin transport system outer membrane protein